MGRIERSLARNLGGDDFVTAVVAGCPEPGRLEVVNCGHAPPLLIRGTEVTAVEPVHPTPPLGLRALSEEAPRLQVVPFGDGDQLLLYTDGVTEARDADRAFYPLTEGVTRHLCDEPPGRWPRCTRTCWPTWAAGCTTTRRCSCCAGRPPPRPGSPPGRPPWRTWTVPRPPEARSLRVTRTPSCGGHLTEPPVMPAAMYFWARTSRTAAGTAESTAAAMTDPQSPTWAPMYW